MSAKLSVGWSFVAASVSFLLGSACSYAVYYNLAEAHVSNRVQDVQRPLEAVEHQTVSAPSNKEATTAIAKSGRSMVISECKSRQTVPGVTCTGIITTVTGSFAGSKHPGMLSFAKIDGRWVQMQ